MGVPKSLPKFRKFLSEMKQQVDAMDDKYYVVSAW